MIWKPIAASLAVVVLALGGMAVWSTFGGDAAEPEPPAEGPSTDPEEDGPAWERVALEPRDSLDPLGLWPLPGMRISSPRFWVHWQTEGQQSQCRLLARRENGVWREQGFTSAQIHYLSLDLDQFDSELWFCVEWTERGREYRSAERHISFGAGAAFEQRQYRIAVPSQGEHRFKMRLHGREISQLRSDSFLTTLLPDNLVCYVLPNADGGFVEFVIADGAAVPAGGCLGFLQVYDSATDTYDRVLIELRPV